MPTLRQFSTIDVFALLDSDTAEAKTYRTYLTYWDCLARAVTSTYGDDWHAQLLGAVQARPSFKSMSGQSLFNGDSDELRGLLLNAWNSELNLYLVDDNDPRLQPATQWAPVLGYYATGRAALAWLLVRDGNAPTKHRPLLRSLAAQIANMDLYPAPWSYHLSLLGPLTWHNFPSEPSDCNALSNNVPPIDGIAKMLKTTRDRRVEERKDDQRDREKRKRARPGEYQRQDAGLEPTTIFDFTWRSRTRSNYGDPSMFYVGALGSQDLAARFVNAVRVFTASTMFVFETLLAQRASDALVEAAVHYISRDRTKITDQLVGERMRVLGLI
jgi:hypothetical protein